MMGNAIARPPAMPTKAVTHSKHDFKTLIRTRTVEHQAERHVQTSDLRSCTNILREQQVAWDSSDAYGGMPT